jgi:RNA polymerase sigma-70 factor (ECF subfamily)
MTVSQYNQCVDLHADAVYRFIVKNLRDEDAAQDVVQDAFEKVWLKAEEIQFEKAKSYLFTTAYRFMLERIRKQSRIIPLDEQSAHRISDTYNAPEVDLKRILDEALARLPEIQRSVIMLRDYEGYSYEEIGTITGLNASQVKVYIFRARVSLKNYLVSKECVA